MNPKTAGRIAVLEVPGMKDEELTTYPVPQARWRPTRRVGRLALFAVVMLPVVTWAVAPSTMVYLLMHPRRMPLPPATDKLPFPVESVAWHTADGLTMRGWFGHTTAQAPVILLGHGDPGNRATML